MNRICAVMITGLFSLFINTIACSQDYLQKPKAIIIEPYHLQVTVNKTTNLIFPQSIKSVDRGSRDILAQKAKGVENILLVKAGREDLTETNLSVITSEGKLYSFLINYSSNPAPLNISFLKETEIKPATLLLPENKEAHWQATTEQIAREERTHYGVKKTRYKMRLRLNGLYIKDDMAYYSLEVKNRSNISYDIEVLRFSILEEKNVKRTASQEIEVQPLFVSGDTSAIRGQSKNLLVYVLPKFTIPDKKYLSIQLMERNGGRHVQLKLHNRTIVKAKPIE